MRSLKNLGLCTLAALILGLCLIPGALADNQVIKPLSTEPANTAYALESGQFYDNVLFLPLTGPTGRVSGIMFHGLGVEEDAYINNATLRLKFVLGAPAGSAPVTIYGITSRFGQNHGFYSASDLLSAELSGASLTVDLGSTVTADGFYNFDVTEIVGEIVSKSDWELYDNVGLVFLSAEGAPDRVISTNNWLAPWFPQINVTWGLDPETGPPDEDFEYQGTHGDYDVYNYTGTFSPVLWSAQGNSFYTVQSRPNDDGVSFTAEILTNYTGPATWHKLDGVDCMQLYGDRLYTLFRNSSNVKQAIIAYTTNKGYNWTVDFTINHTANIAIETTDGVAGMIYNEPLNRWHVFLCSNNALMYMYQYFPVNNTQDAGIQLQQSWGYGDYPNRPMSYVDSEGRLYVALASSDPSGSAVDPRYITWYSGVLDKATFDEPTLVGTQSCGVDGYIDPNTGEEWIIFLWTWSDQSGETDNSGWIRVMAAGDDIDILNGTYLGSGSALKGWQRITEQTTRSADEIIIDEDGRIWVLGYKASAGIYCPALSYLPYVGAPDVYFGNLSYTHQADAATPLDIYQNSALYLNPVTGGPGLMASSITGSTSYQAWIDPACINGTYYNETLYTVHASAFGWLYGGKTAVQWEKKKINDFETAINHNFYPHYNRIYAARYWGDEVGGWRVLKNGEVITSPCLEAAVTYQDILDCLDTLDPDNIDPDEPNPGGWDETGYLTRSKLKLYFLVLALLCEIAPALYLAYSKNWDALVPVLFVMFFGIALFLVMNSI